MQKPNFFSSSSPSGGTNKQHEEVVRDSIDTGWALERINSLNGSIQIHTSMLPVIVLLLMFVTVQQVNMVIGEDLYRFHHDPVLQEIREKIVEITELLGVEHYFDEDKTKIVVAAELQAIIAGHWQTAAFQWILIVNVLIVVPYFIRFYFLQSRQNFIIMTVITYVLLISSILQLLCTLIRVGICVSMPLTMWSLFGIALNTLLFFVEMATYAEVLDVRTWTIKLGRIHKEYVINNGGVDDYLDDSPEIIGASRNEGARKRRKGQRNPSQFFYYENVWLNFLMNLQFCMQKKERGSKSKKN